MVKKGEVPKIGNLTLLSSLTLHNPCISVAHKAFPAEDILSAGNRQTYYASEDLACRAQPTCQENDHQQNNG